MKNNEMLRDFFHVYRKLDELQKEIYEIKINNQEDFISLADEFTHMYETYKDIDGFDKFEKSYEEIKPILEKEQEKQFTLGKVINHTKELTHKFINNI